MNPPSLRCVVDASVGIKLLVAEPLSEQADALFAHLAKDPGAEFFVPDLFYVECANILWKVVRRLAATADDARRGLAQLSTLALIPVATQELVDDALALALQHDITAYDASYVVLAQRERVPLVTADQRLLNKLAETGCTVHWIGAGPPPTLRAAP